MIDKSMVLADRPRFQRNQMLNYNHEATEKGRFSILNLIYYVLTIKK
jgi:hypothetical protein